MDKVKKFIDKFKIGFSSRYKEFVIVFIVLLFVFISSKLYLPDISKPLQTDLGTSIEISPQVEAYLYNFEYNPKNKMMEATFLINNKVFKYNINYIASSYEAATKEQFKTKIVYGENDILIVDIFDIPSSFKNVVLNLSTDDSNTNSKAKFICDYRAIKHNDNLNGKDEREYKIIGYNARIDKVDKDINGLNDKIKECQSTINACQKDIEALEKNKEFQTQDEIKTTVSAQHNKQSNIKTEQSTIESYNYQIEQLNNKKSKYKSKLDELNYK